MTDMVECGHHDFVPLRWWDGRRKHGRCRHCHVSRYLHPVTVWCGAAADV